MMKGMLMFGNSVFVESLEILHIHHTTAPNGPTIVLNITYSNGKSLGDIMSEFSLNNQFKASIIEKANKDYYSVNPLKTRANFSTEAEYKRYVDQSLQTLNNYREKYDQAVFSNGCKPGCGTTGAK